MINTKELYNDLLFNDELIELLGNEDNIVNSYPNSVINFPCVIFLDSNQNDIEYADNKSLGVNCSVEIHIFTKKIEGYPTTMQIASVVDKIMNNNYWNCSLNGETSDVDDSVEHRVMHYDKPIIY